LIRQRLDHERATRNCILDPASRTGSGMTAPTGGLLRASMASGGLSLTLENRIDALGPGHAALRAFLEQRGVGRRGLYDAGLVFEELFINTIRYGYADLAKHLIEVKLDLSGDDIVMTFDDDARGFDPTVAQARVAPVSIEEAKLGGLGLMLVRKAARTMQYHRADGRNTLRISIPRFG
jgi:anti-sigma regulatory factor (Ser/Thr protein kinase)